MRFNHNSNANFSFTCEHHYKLFINTFFKYSFCHSACKAEKTVHRWIFNHNAKQRLFLSSINLLFLRQDCQDSIYPVLSRVHLMVNYNNSFICICYHFKTTKFDAFPGKHAPVSSSMLTHAASNQSPPPPPLSTLLIIKVTQGYYEHQCRSELSFYSRANLRTPLEPSLLSHRSKLVSYQFNSSLVG